MRNTETRLKAEFAVLETRAEAAQELAAARAEAVKYRRLHEVATTALFFAGAIATVSTGTLVGVILWLKGGC